MRTRARLIVTAAMAVALGAGAGVVAATPATAGPAVTGASAGASGVETSASWIYHSTHTSSQRCLLTGLALRHNGIADRTTCEFYPGHQHVWKLYYR